MKDNEWIKGENIVNGGKPDEDDACVVIYISSKEQERLKNIGKTHYIFKLLER